MRCPTDVTAGSDPPKKWRSEKSRRAGCMVYVLRRSGRGFRFHRSDVIDDALRPTVDVRPAILVADAVLVRRHVHDVRVLQYLMLQAPANRDARPTCQARGLFGRALAI